VFGFVGKPLWYEESVMTDYLSSHIGFFKGSAMLLDENSALKSQMADYSAMNIDRTVLRQENDALKKVETSQGEVARVLSGPAESFYDVIVLELAPNSTAQTGDYVYGPDDVILGTIIMRTGNLAKVKLFSSAGETTTVRLSRTGTTLYLTGRGGGNFFVEVPRSLDISVGDAVVLPNFATSILGTVVSVQPGRADSYNNVYISDPLNVFALTWVNIIHAQ
jgi:cell shape-determining protein MreC